MARMIQIGKRRWLVGLTWNTFEEVPNKNELREDAKLLGASWVALRTNEQAIQAGFSAQVGNVEHPTNLYSLASILADAHEQPWAGVYKLDENLWWYIAVRYGNGMLPDGDVVGTEAEILAARENHAHFADWNVVEGDITSLTESIGSIHEKPAPIRSLNGTHLPVPRSAIYAGLAIVLVAGTYLWWNHKNNEELERIAAMGKLRAELVKSNQKSPDFSPLLQIPQANDWIKACGDVMLNLPISQYGWTIDKLSCGNQSVSVSWKRNHGATVSFKPEGSLSPQGDSVDQIIGLSTLALIGKNDAVDLDAAKILLRSWAQEANFHLTISETPSSQVLPGASVDTAHSTNSAAQVAFQLTIPVSPFYIDWNIPGLRLQNLKDMGDGWALEGVLYGR